jgi:hypothetical protein
MIKVLLMGGLGNQFFQIARAIELIDRSFDVELVFISQRFDSFYRLTGHTKHDQWIDVNNLASSLKLNCRSISLSEFLFLGIKFFLKKLGLVSSFNIELDSLCKYKKNNSSMLDVGYFQSIKHVSLNSVNKVAYGLIDLLQTDEIPTKEFSVFHIRGGDFINRDSEYIVSIDDVKNAINSIKNQTNRIFVATNDNSFSNKIFRTLDVDFEISKLSPKNDFITIATAKSVFVSNSSFAFWAALCAKLAYRSTIFSLNSWPYADFLPTLSHKDDRI